MIQTVKVQGLIHSLLLHKAKQPPKGNSKTQTFIPVRIYLVTSPAQHLVKKHLHGNWKRKSLKDQPGCLPHQAETEVLK